MPGIYLPIFTDVGPHITTIKKIALQNSRELGTFYISEFSQLLLPFIISSASLQFNDQHRPITVEITKSSNQYAGNKYCLFHSYFNMDDSENVLFLGSGY